MKKRILIIDDEEDIRDAVAVLLEFNGYNVVKAPNGIDALSILDKDSKFDLILCDYFMPKMNGAKVCEVIRNEPKLKHLKIIFLTVARFGKE